MSYDSIVIVTNRERNKFLVESISKKIKTKTHLIQKESDFTYDNLSKLSPRWIFVPHWSKLIPAEIYENFQVVIFHMTDLPFGRGGSPLQNLIMQGFESTSISAIQCTKELDGGPIYLKEPLSLHGTADEILIRASRIIENMIIRIVKENPSPTPQIGTPTYFKRRKPDESRIDISQISSLEKLYDFIRMLDGEGYPPAFLEIGNFRISFCSPHLRYGYIESQVKIEQVKFPTLDSDEQN
ncbi:methionyl-tRNA formyltransferase [Thermosynechococcus sp. B0]|uniref:formyltransferase family protein n=1 Tax=unclassified Thermosynechococcus TaxID=2622553 RepID=UPI0025783B53|nr:MULTISPECIES: formyltransferase family protein [unclassified Thermosynechococcus]WJI24221.1 methionyl-tRNA formyltransferase [Thermosynechococcus sp. B0]WJI26735.1 methionyl-tRNA formyltransferase [Thermosynechococcus sp. B1]WJI29263.1 methionyl-tRNA formyltransferase [Thermosynechococcus sp. B3]